MDNPEARCYLVDQLRRFLVGPHDGENEAIQAGKVRSKGGKRFRAITQIPYDFYHTGFLSPTKTDIDIDEDDQDDQGSEVDQGVGEGIMVMANTAQQSAMGMTFQVDDLENELTVTAKWGRYTIEEILNDNENKDGDSGSDSKQWSEIASLVWRRVPCELVLEFYPSNIGDGQSTKSDIKDGGQLQVHRREVKGVHFVTVTIVNVIETLDEERRLRENDFRLYQVNVSVESSNGEPCFTASQNTARRPDEDLWQQELLYRNVRQYAVGHGCSAIWDESPEHKRAHHIATEWIPKCEVFKASADVIEESGFLELCRLSDFTDFKQTIVNLRKLTQEYGRWIDACVESLPQIMVDFTDDCREDIGNAANKNIKLCEIQCERIEAGIDFLESNSVAYESFCLANQAMALSMDKSRPDSTPKWFPFQLAFILIAIPSLSDRNHVDRDVLDLIWFPTGGGKTEAYLGLSAYTLFYRGLMANSAEEADGTAIITRYTLRTLTVQQFERTTLAIMCCEKVRREHEKLTSHNPWSIGLLVGAASTPKWVSSNSPDDGSAESLLKQYDDKARGALLPLKKCPWCGNALSLDDLELDKENQALLTSCGDATCDFHDLIPIRFVDKHIEASPPSFIVSTIDKFAQLAWEPNLSRLLGCGTTANPPDLIIQDELHLITDSLGTIAGLYEMAIDILASHNGIGPKVIGATATIKQAEKQVMSLFQRKTIQFPSSGIDEADSFFYAGDKKSPGRWYVGIHAQGRSPKHTLPRILAILSQSVNDIEPISIRDNFWTCVTYFNSLRELGGALVVAEDDVPTYQKTLSKITGKQYRPLGHKVEMTSQVPSHQIPERLEMLNVGLESDDENMEPVDLLFATSMISVGVDVDRLGTMVISGQPKTTAEYIQASSRVGRPKGSAGLVVTQYNWTRPRDRSHYERFTAYHKSFYRFVEAVSVTPFASRARDKALEGVVALMVRTMVPELHDNEIKVTGDVPASIKERIDGIKKDILLRVGKIDDRELDDTLVHLDNIFARLIEFLETENEAGKYWTRWRVGQEARSKGIFMLSSGIGGMEEDGFWTAMLSMRDTDAPTTLRLM